MREITDKNLWPPHVHSYMCIHVYTHKCTYVNVYTHTPKSVSRNTQSSLPPKGIYGGGMEKKPLCRVERTLEIISCSSSDSWGN